VIATLSRTLPTGLTVTLVETGSIDRTGVWAEMEWNGEARRTYLTPGKDPLNQWDLDRVDAELIERWWEVAG
jgi:hypothetical protein